jgi:hypothetical protein
MTVVSAGDEIREQNQCTKTAENIDACSRRLVRIRPARDASSAAWLAYYQQSVALYEHIAEIDPGHELEALYWAQRERIRARNIADQIRAQATGE